MAKNGFAKETREIYDEYKKSEFRTNHELVSTNMIDSLTICGTPEDCMKKLSKFIKAGVSLPIIQFNPIGEITKSFKLLVSTLSGSKN